MPPKPKEGPLGIEKSADSFAQQVEGSKPLPKEGPALGIEKSEDSFMKEVEGQKPQGPIEDSANVTSGSTPTPVPTTESLMGFIIILLDENGKVEFFFVESETFPSQDVIRQALLGKFQKGHNVFRMGANVNDGSYVFTLTPIGGTGATLTYDTINIGTMPTEKDLGTNTRITAYTPVDVTSFLNNISDLITNSQQLLAKNPYTTPVIGFESMGLEFEVRRDNNDRIFELKNVKEKKVYASGKFQAFGGGARRRARRVLGALACVATAKAKHMPLKPLGFKPTPDGKVRMVYRMGHLHVVRMRPPGCSKIVPVPVRDLKHINTGVRRRRQRAVMRAG